MARDVITICNDQAERYCRGSLSMLSSKYFPLYRALLSAAFLEDFSKAVDEETFMSRIGLAYEAIADAVKNETIDLALPVGSAHDVLPSIVRDMKRNRGYLSVSRTNTGVYEYRLTSDALRAFDAVDTLSSVSRNEFNGARIDTVLREINRFEKLLQGDPTERIAAIDSEIAKLQEEREQVVERGIDPPSDTEIVDELWNLSSLIEALPASVRALADEVRDRGRAFRNSIESGQVAVSRELQTFSSDLLSMIGDSDAGRAYLDAMSVLTGDDDIMDIEDRLISLEETVESMGIDAEGIVSGKWSFIVSVCDEVSGAGRSNVHATTTAIKARSADIGSRSVKLIDKALHTFNRNNYQKQFSIPWGVTNIGASWWFDADVISEKGVAGFDDVVDETKSVDFDTMRMLSGPHTETLLRSLLEAAPYGQFSVSEVFNSLSVDVRRFVEWGSLSVVLTRMGFAASGHGTWMLVDSEGNEVAWVADDYVGDKSLLEKYFEEGKE